MDTGELTRAVIGVPAAAIALPLAPGMHDRRLRAVAVLGLAAWAIGPSLDQARSWPLLVLALLAAQLIDQDAPARHTVPLVGILGGALAAASAAVLDSSAATDAAEAAWGSGDAVVVAGGALLATFVGGATIGFLLEPFAKLVKTPDAAEDLTHAGMRIGWLERALVYGFVVAGAPGAVALVVAAKSIARFPSFKEEKFAEYFLIGTLASVLLATGCGVAVRAILGVGPLLS